MGKINKIKRSDFNRILITETLPYETPIIFSNDGIYDRIANLDSANQIQRLFLKALIFGEALQKPVNSTIPYIYKIRKNSLEFRRLALLHPMSQWRIKCFYERYEKLILHYCSLSPASIRAPNNIAGSFYNKNSWENVNQYKKGNVSLSTTDKYAKHSPSFFAYRGYDRLFKFFNSRDYFSLEKRFPILLTLDVAKCFDSIYTHCLSWAVKDKQFTKKNVGISSTFAQDFDAAIRHGNHNETNGIPIGPEASRVFAEVLFQEVDRQAIAKLKFRFGSDYVFRRYVDDVFIFAKDDATSRAVYEAYADVLVSFNLHANTAKSVRSGRPFLTKRSRLVSEAGQQANNFFDKFLLQQNSSSLIPVKVFSSWKLTKSYIDSVKALCMHSEVHYDEIASFLIAVVTERFKQLVSKDLEKGDPDAGWDYVCAIEILLDVQFFLYSVAPSVSASYKLSTSIVLAIRFSERNLQEHSEAISQRIYDLVATLLTDECCRPDAEGVDGFISLESLNIVLAARELGDDYLLPEKMLEKLFIEGKQLSYFTIISCLFYVKSHPRFSKLRNELIAVVTDKLSDLSDIFMNCEKAYLLLDALGCPFIGDVPKKNWTKALHKLLAQPQPTKAILDEFLDDVKKEHWQLNWMGVDLLSSLEKKELKQAY